jgi:hypothetical protein
VVVIGDGSQRTSAVSGCHAEIATNQRRVASRSSKSLVMTVAGRPAARAACRCRRLAQPFFPQNLLYYDIAQPHHLVKFVRSFGYLAPQVTVEMTKVYIASNQRDDAQAQWARCTRIRGRCGAVAHQFAASRSSEVCWTRRFPLMACEGGDQYSIPSW